MVVKIVSISKWHFYCTFRHFERSQAKFDNIRTYVNKLYRMQVIGSNNRRVQIRQNLITKVCPCTRMEIRTRRKNPELLEAAKHPH